MNYFFKSKFFRFLVLILFGFGILNVIYPDRINNLSKKNYKLTTRVYVNNNYLRNCISHSNQTLKLVETPIRTGGRSSRQGKIIMIQSEGFLENNCPYDINYTYLKFHDPVLHEMRFGQSWGMHGQKDRDGNTLIKENSGRFQFNNEELNKSYLNSSGFLIPKSSAIPIEIWFFVDSESIYYKNDWHKNNPKIIFKPFGIYPSVMERGNYEKIWKSLSGKNLVSYVVTISNPYHGNRKILFAPSGCSVNRHVLGLSERVPFFKKSKIIEGGCKSEKWGIKNKNGEFIKNANDYTEYLLETNFKFDENAKKFRPNIVMPNAKRAFKALEYN